MTIIDNFIEKFYLYDGDRNNAVWLISKQCADSVMDWIDKNKHNTLTAQARVPTILGIPFIVTDTKEIQLAYAPLWINQSNRFLSKENCTDDCS